MSIATLIVIGCIGLVFVAISVIADEIFDFFGGEPVIPSIAVFTAAFGFSGALGRNISDNDTTAFLLIPVAVGLLFAGLFWMSFRALKKLADDDELLAPKPEAMLGATAKIDWFIWDEETNHGQGEALIQYAGQNRKIAVTANEKLGASKITYVTEVISDKQVVVSSVPLGSAEQPKEIEGPTA